MKLTEDDIYRSSTQFRNWSFTPAQLAEQRQKTNQQASERVKAAVARQRAQRAKQPQNDTPSASENERNGSGVDTGSNTPLTTGDNEVDCLTVAEEMKLVDTFCDKALELGGVFFKFPHEVTATCIQFLRRFYLFNSPMTYEGQNISRTAMFIANKAESYFLNAENYAARFGPKATAEKVLAPEYLIIQALRYNLDVRHPFRGLKGGHLELIELAQGKLASLPDVTQSPAELQKSMLLLPRKAGGPGVRMTVTELEQRITNAYGFASNVLKTAALLTDVYFLYTPSHIWLASHLLADEPLTLFYLSTKIPPAHPFHTKTMNTIRACANLLSSHKSFIPVNAPPVDKADKEAREKNDKEEIARLVKKLKQCRDPDKIDLVKLNQAQKRDAVTEDGLEENKAKRRKLKRDGFEKEAEGFWGPELPTEINGEAK